MKKLFGRKPDVTEPYRITLSTVPIWHATGDKMISRIKLDSMLEQQGKGGDLVLIWDDEGKKEAEEDGVEAS
ncbi:hypothetical protein GGS21DRAFT_505214 [Xylaria nigripes]|nr:hypothetical protein GGS21DRAFT_505214 [Xylaria nigripes]